VEDFGLEREVWGFHDAYYIVPVLVLFYRGRQGTRETGTMGTGKMGVGRQCWRYDGGGDPQFLGG